MATDSNIGGMAVNALSGTDMGRASTWVAWSGAHCCWHSGLVGVPPISAQSSPIAVIEAGAVIAVTWPMVSGTA